MTYKDMVIWADTSGNTIKIVNKNNGLIKIIKVETLSINITNEDKKRLIEEMFANQQLPAKINFRDVFPYIGHFGINDEGILYIRTYEQRSDNEYSYVVYPILSQTAIVN